MKTHKPRQEETHQPGTKYPPEFYEILVQGQLDDVWKHWFAGMALSNMKNEESGDSCTLISGKVADQAALHGLLIKIRDLNLKLLSVRRINPDKNNSVEIAINLDQQKPGKSNLAG